jgi:quinol---cytochrome c reductase iron-sulfur subunit, bacillus type
MPHDDPTNIPLETPPQALSEEAESAVVSRRWLLLKASIALNGLAGLALAYPIIRYFFSPAKPGKDFKSWISLGTLDAFPVGQTRLAYYKNPYARGWDGQTDNTACYVRRIANSDVQVFAVNCAHLNCPVRWFPESQLFMCPCHGGVYYADGSRASGPPPRGLFTYQWKIAGEELHILAGQMPTLSNSAKLVNISIGKGDAPCRG